MKIYGKIIILLFIHTAFAFSAQAEVSCDGPGTDPTLDAYARMLPACCEGSARMKNQAITTRTTSHPATTRTISYPATTRTISHPATTRTTSHPATTRTGSHPATTRTGSHPATTRTISHPAGTSTPGKDGSDGNISRPPATTTGMIGRSAAELMGLLQSHVPLVYLPGTTPLVSAHTDLTQPDTLPADNARTDLTQPDTIPADSARTDLTQPDTIPADSARKGLTQPDTIPADSLAQRPAREGTKDSLTIALPDIASGTALHRDSIPPDTAAYRISADALDEKVDYGALDSIIYDNGTKIVHLYGEAYVNYNTIELRAGYIRLELDKDLAFAEGIPDSAGRTHQFPRFKDGDQNFEARVMRYNFKTKKAYIESIVSVENDLYLRGTRTKYEAADEENGVSYDRISNEQAIFTTCDAPEPHFGIRSRKQKLIPNRLVVVGPSNVEVGGVPTPLWLPFGFFPMSKGKRAGIIFPRDWENSPRLGLGVRGLGYYIPINEYYDLTLKGNIYLRGTWGIEAYSKYRKRYKYNGNVSVLYSSQVLEDPTTFTPVRNPGFNLEWSHTQDPKANPYHTFNGRVSLQTNNFRSNNYNDAGSVLQNEISSSMTYTWSPAEKPYRVTASFNHSQNTNTRKMILNLPNLDFNMQQIKPFERKNRVGREQWYEKITFKYDAKFRNKIEAQDTSFFEKETWENAQYGFEHRAGVQAPFRALKYFTVNPTMNYQEYWYFKTLDRRFDPTEIVEIVSRDTIDGEEIITYDTTFGQVIERTDYGFAPLRTFNAGVNMSTQVFGTLLFRKGYLRGLRHMIKANFGFTYTPDFTADQFGYFGMVDTDTRPEFNDPVRFNRFVNGPFGTPSVPGEARRLTFNFINNFEAKVYSRKDSTVKKIPLFQNINVNGNYNFAADSLKWSAIGLRGTTQIIKGVSTANVRVTWDPYQLDANDRRIDRFVYQSGGGLLRLDNWNVTVNSTLRFSQILQWLRKKEAADADKESQMASPWVTFFDLFKDFNFRHDISFTRLNRNLTDTLVMDNHTLSVNGAIQIAQKWRVGIQQLGYDFKSKGLSYPYFVFERDLHCWSLAFSWAPDRGAYTLSLGVKPGTLDFIKIPYRQNQFDGGFNPF